MYIGKTLLSLKQKGWSKVPWVAFKEYLTRKESEEFFGEKASKLKYEYHKDDKNNREADKTACVYAIWSKKKRKVIHIHKHCDEILSEEDPPLKFIDFWPCPRPLYAVRTNSTTLPVPEFTLWQDQANDIDDLTIRIAMLTEAIQVTGLYNGAFSELKNAIILI